MARTPGRSARTRPPALVFLLILALLATLLPAHAETGLETLTLTGPTQALLSESTTYSGSLTASGLGVPLEEIELLIDGTPAATATTDLDGNYSADLTLTTYGFHDLQAVAHAGTALETRSPLLTVEAVPELDETVATDIYSSSTFLYTGPDAVQTGVAVGTIEPKRAAVLRGAVTTAAGVPLQDVKVTIAGHPELGETQTTDEGLLDMGVNGGELLTVRYAKPGYITSERQIGVAWREYRNLPEVVMVPYDQNVTQVNLTSSGMKVAQGSAVTDSEGSRQATLLFPQGTSATMRLPDGTTQSLSTINVRATEFTVGEAGPSAMPAELPAQSGYTYAVELSVDEAVAAGATKVSFSKAVPVYVENFLDFPVGMAVPVGYYDRERHAWVASDNGRVVKIVSITSGMADLDVDGDGTADTGSALTDLGITDPERARLAELYPAGQSLWRVAVTHFTPWDCNWPYGLPEGATAPGQEEGSPADLSGQCTQAGSIIGCENQTLGEAIPVAGTPFHLRYESSRVPGRKATNSLRIPLTGATLPNGLKRVELEVEVAGRRFFFTLDPPAAGFAYTFTWDGKDAYGRFVQGAQSASVRIAYVYEAVYTTPANFARSFGQAGGAPIQGSRARQEITVYQSYKREIGGLYDSSLQALGGWTISAHHSYDPDGGVLHLGSGETRRSEAYFRAIASFAGNGSSGPAGEGTYTGDGGAATSAGLSHAKGLAAAPDGTLYIADTGNGVVRTVTPDGVITTFAGGGTPAGGNGDGGAATDAELISPWDVAVASDGSVFISDPGENRIRRVSPQGTITTYAGGGSPPDGLGDGGPATSAALNSPKGIDVAPAGTLYIADTANHRVRQVTAEGTITTFAGGGAPADGLGDGLPAPQAKLKTPLDVAVGTDLAVYISDSDHDRVRRVRRDGMIETFAGSGVAGSGGDGGAATQAQLSAPYGIAFDPTDGTLYIAQRIHHKVRAVRANGIITTAAGTGSSGSLGDAGPPPRAQLKEPHAVAVGSDGRLYVADTFNFRVRRVLLSVQGFSSSDFLVPSPDGAEIFHFNSSGRHLRTLDSLTGAVLWRFGYDTSGRLSSVEDDFGNVTTIERDSAGAPTAIVSPFGIRTSLTVNASGYLASVTNAANETVSLAYGEGGLLTSLTTPRGFVYRFTYDLLGRLVKDEGPDGASTTLEKTDTQSGYQVKTTSAMGRATVYELEILPTGEKRRSVTYPSGVKTVASTFPDGTVKVTSPDGTVTTSRLGPDPRFGLQTPIPESTTLTTPGGKSVTTTASRAITLSDPVNPLSLTSQTDSVTTNAKTASRTFDKAALTITATTAEGRQGVTTFNAKVRVVKLQEGNLAPVTFDYDTRGRVISTTEGSGTDARTSTVAYDAAGFVQKITNALGQETSFTRDAVGRVLSSVLPDTKKIDFSYDSSGNLSSLTPPERGAHGFEYTEAEIVHKYSPPAFDPSDPSTSYSYNLDRQPTAVALPGNRTVSFGYDTSGRLSTTGFSRGGIAYSYDSVSRLSRIDAPGAEVLKYAYDGSLLTSTTSEGTSAGTVSYGYNSDLRLSSRSINGGTATTYSYDKDGLLTEAGSLSLSWDATNGYLNSTTTGGTTPVTTSHTHSSFGEPASTTASYGSTQLYSVSFERDKLGRIAKKTETLGGVTSVYDYTYDPRGRLTEVKKDGVSSHTFSYDANGNRTGATGPSGAVAATYDSQDRMTSYGGATYTYTENGELKSKTDSGGTTSYDYDELGNLVKVTLPNSTVIEYAIDSLGRRIAKKVNGTITQRFLYGTGLLPIAELDASGNVVATFTYASRSHSPDLMTKGGATYRIVSDHLGSPRLVVNASTGEIVQRIDYDAFGKVTADTNPGFQPFGFAGGLYDPDTGLVRFGVRDYDPTSGRWTAKDPIAFASGDPNLYLYVANDPVNFIDPTGLLRNDPAFHSFTPLEEWARIFEWVDKAWGTLQCAEAMAAAAIEWAWGPASRFWLRNLRCAGNLVCTASYYGTISVTACAAFCVVVGTSGAGGRNRLLIGAAAFSLPPVGISAFWTPGAPEEGEFEDHAAGICYVACTGAIYQDGWLWAGLGIGTPGALVGPLNYNVYDLGPSE